MSEIPICECSVVWPEKGHAPDCPVRLEIERLRADIKLMKEQLGIANSLFTTTAALLDELKLTPEELAALGDFPADAVEHWLKGEIWVGGQWVPIEETGLGGLAMYSEELGEEFDEPTVAR